MEYTRDHRRETEWKDYFAIFPVAIETINIIGNVFPNEENLKYVWWKKIERRTIALPNARTGILYRMRGSTWDHKRTKKPAPPSSMRIDGELN